MSDGSLLDETLKEMPGMRGDITQAGKNSQAMLEKMKRMGKILLQFHWESEIQYEVLSSKISDTNRDARDISNKLDDIQEGVKQLQDSPLDLALCYIDEFKASKGEELKYLDKAYHRSMEALTTMNYSSLDAVFAASTIAISTRYTWRAKVLSAPPSNALISKRNSPAEAKIRVFDGTFKIIICKLEPYWKTEFANITTKGLKAVEFLMGIASFICRLPPANVLLPPINDGLVQMFGSLCALKPDMLHRYPDLGTAALLSLLWKKPLGILCQISGDLGLDGTIYVNKADAIQALLDTERPLADALGLSKPKPEMLERPAWMDHWFEIRKGISVDKSVFYHYAERGSLQDLHRLLNLATLPLDEQMCYHAAKGGDLDVFKWLRDKCCAWGSETCTAAAKGGHLDVPQWVRGQVCPWDVKACTAAAYSGYLKVLKWLHRTGCPWDLNTCAAAARSGHLDVLQWAQANGCPWTASTCTEAAHNGYLDVLQWARGKGCPWHVRTCSAAARGGQLGILKWARENGCPWDKMTCTAAATEGHLEVLQWAWENDCPWDET